VGLYSQKSLNLTNVYPNNKKKKNNNNNNKVKSKPIELYEIAGKKQKKKNSLLYKCSVKLTKETVSNSFTKSCSFLSHLLSSKTPCR
jgi:hypothetical protein